jgi:hypothetical protein
MKNTLIIAYFFIASQTLLFAQKRREFLPQSNGLIYSDVAMNKLHYIIDSLNLKFKKCEINSSFRSYPTTQAHYLKIDSKLIKNLQEAFLDTVSFDNFVKNYAPKEVRKDVWLYKINDEYQSNGKLKKDTKLREIINGNRLGVSMKRDTVIKSKGWIFKESDKEIEAYYILNPLSNNNTVLPKYASMIQYTECLIDTTSQVLLKDAKSSEDITSRSEKDYPNIIKFFELVNKFQNKPIFNYKNSKKDSENAVKERLAFVEYYKKVHVWDSLRMDHVRNTLSKTMEFNTLLDKSIEEAVERKGSSEELEFYIGEFRSKKIALQLKRSRRVIGTCSMDSSPRIHAQQIAQLAAESINWEVFLRAHLDIMNDRFDRNSDGSYAYGKRNTYIAELETLGIDVSDLLIGTCLRVENVAKNHYFGNIGRIGRALSETKNKDEVETKMLEMIIDKELDMYNRMLIGYLFGNYNDYLVDKKRQQLNSEKYQLALSSLPDYIGKHIDEQMNKK